MKTDCSVVILAAGRSSRMGKAKFALRFSSEKIFLKEIIDQYLLFGCRDVVVVLNEKGENLLNQLHHSLPEQVKIAINHHPEKGRFYSIKTGIKQTTQKNFVFVHNVDNPFVNKEVLKLLFNGIPNADYCFPVYNGRGGHPVLLSGNIVKGVISEKENDISLREFLKRYEGRKLMVNSDKVLVNINTMKEYLRFF